jgi:predicted nuclease of predicted toxin-antitoxin system
MFIRVQSMYGCGLGSAEDSTIWRYAGENGFTIISKDSDFQERSVLQGQPPKFVWLRVANCSTDEIENLLRMAQPVIQRFIQENEESCLILGAKPKTI